MEYTHYNTHAQNLYVHDDHDFEVIDTQMSGSHTVTQTHTHTHTHTHTLWHAHTHTHIHTRTVVAHTHAHTQMSLVLVQSVVLGNLIDYFSIEVPTKEDTRNAYLYTAGKFIPN